MTKQLFACKGRLSIGDVLTKIAETIDGQSQFGVIDMDAIVQDAHDRAQDCYRNVINAYDEATHE